MQTFTLELLLGWRKSEASTYLHHDTQSEIIRLKAFMILRVIAKNINYSIMADEVTGCSNRMQFVICFRWVDSNTYNTYKDFVGIHKLIALNEINLLEL